MRALDADDHALVLHRDVGGGLDFHVRQVLLHIGPAGHAGADDVEKRRHSRPRLVDDPALEIVEVPPPGTAGVGNRRHTAAQREAVRIDAAISFRVPVRYLAVVGVDVHVDETRRDVEAGDVDGFQGALCRNIRLDGGNLAVLDRNVADGADSILAVDDAPALD